MALKLPRPYASRSLCTCGGFLRRNVALPPVNLDMIRRRITREMDELISQDKVKIRRAVRYMMNRETFILVSVIKYFPIFSYKMDETDVKSKRIKINLKENCFFIVQIYVTLYHISFANLNS